MRSAKDFRPWDATSGGGLKQSVRAVHSMLAAARPKAPVGKPPDLVSLTPTAVQQTARKQIVPRISQKRLGRACGPMSRPRSGDGSLREDPDATRTGTCGHGSAGGCSRRRGLFGGRGPPEGGNTPHMQDVPRLREEAADFAWDVAPLEQLGAVRAIASGSPAGGSEPSDHLQPLYEGLQVKLATGIRAELDDLLTRHRETFSEGDHDLGRTRTEVHRIPTEDARPVRLPPRRVPLAY